MKKRFLLIFFVFLLPLWLGSWFSPTSSDQFSGILVYSDSSVDPVTILSGNAVFIFPDNPDFVLTESGSLFNLGESISGFVQVNGVQYSARFQSRSGLQIEQDVRYNISSVRSSWVSYNLYPNKFPSSMSVSEYGLIFISVSVFLCAGFIILSREVI